MRTIARGIKQNNRSSSAVDFWRKKGFQGSRSQLVSMQMISTTQSQVSFAILQTQPNNAGLVYGFEKRLNISDAFVVLSLGLYLGRTVTTTTNANPTNAQAALTKLYTFPNSAVYAAAESANLEAIYNSSLNIKVGQVNWFPSIHTRKFYRVGQAQQGAGPSVVTPANQWDGADYGMMQLVPTITLNGNGNNEFTVTLPDSVNTAVPGAVNLFSNSLVLILDGVILPNAAGKIDLETKNTFATQFGQ
jgi:hypothetical protein